MGAVFFLVRREGGVEERNEASITRYEQEPIASSPIDPAS